MICISHQLLCYWVDGIKEGEVGGECDVYMEEKRNAQRLLVGNREGRRCAEDQVMDGRILLKWMLKQWVKRVQTEFVWLSTKTSGRIL